jgi:hypothetical protein
MASTYFFFSAALLAGQGTCGTVEPVEPPHQELWTCSSTLHWHNRMTCHDVGQVSLPFLDCLGRLCARISHHQPKPVPYVSGGCPRFYRQSASYGMPTAPYTDAHDLVVSPVSSGVSVHIDAVSQEAVLQPVE